MKYLLFSLTFLAITFSDAQNIVFTDPIFKAFLLTPNGSNLIAQNINGEEIQIDNNLDGEIQINEALQVYSLSINGYNSNITDVSGLENFTNLIQLYLNNTYNNYLDVSSLTNLVELNCSSSQISQLNLTGLTSLTSLNCNETQINQLNLSGLTYLSVLDCNRTQITQLNLSGIASLTSLDCSYNNLTELVLTDLLNLEKLTCDGNQLSQLNFTGLNNIFHLSCSSNQFTQLDLTNLTNLNNLNCSYNNLDFLDVSLLTNLEYLICNSCQLTELNLLGLNNLIRVDFSYNNISQIDLTDLTSLIYLICAENQLSNLDLNNLGNLYHLDCSNNNITQINSLNSTNMLWINFSYNQITSFDISLYTNLDFLNCSNNNLNYLILKNGKDLNLNFENNPNLAYICHDEIQEYVVTYLLTLYNNTTTVANTYCSFTPGGLQNTITGNINYDVDNNGCDNNDSLHLLNQKIRIQDQTIEGIDFTNTQGEYKFFTQTGEFSITPIFENSSYFSFSPVDSTIIFYDNNNNIVNLNFCTTPLGIHPDLEVIISPTGVARPGFDSDYQIVFKNKGNQALSGNVTLVYNDDVLDLVSSTVNPTTSSTGNLGWDYTSLLPFETKTIYLVFNTNGPMETPPTNIGDTLNFVASITPDSGDETPLDNVFNLNQIIVGAYDPNIITCLQGEIVSPSEIGNYLHYVVDFENTGNFPAENIVVVENIDPLKYDISSLQVITSSHAISTKITGNKIEFIFENINLQALEHGNFLIKIKSLNTLSIGDTVAQLADIYFDYNFPIQTNNAETVYNYLESGIDENSLVVSISIAPNPSTGNYTVKAESLIKTIEIYDVNGRVILTKIVNDMAVKLDISEKAKGIYYVKSITEKGTSIVKIVKE